MGKKIIVELTDGRQITGKLLRVEGFSLILKDRDKDIYLDIPKIKNLEKAPPDKSVTDILKKTSKWMAWGFLTATGALALLLAIGFGMER